MSTQLEQASTSVWDQLPGGLLVWIVFALEMGTFVLFFFGFVWLTRADPQAFQAGQAMLHPNLGTLNTLILLSGSWMVARAVQATQQNKPTSKWLMATGFSGLLFVGIKSFEYIDLFRAGISLSTHSFWFYYFFLTLLHNLHVLLGVYFLFYLAWKYPSQHLSETQTQNISAAAIYWHLVDLIWIFLFPLIYFTRLW